MTNKIYPKWKEAVIQGGANSSLAGTVKVALIDAGAYAQSDAHEFLTSLAGIVGTPQTLTSKTFVGGVLDGADVTFTAVTGPSVEAIVLYIDTGVAATSRLVAYLDSGYTNLPVTPNGGDVLITWNVAGIVGI